MIINVQEYNREKEICMGQLDLDEINGLKNFLIVK